jgi:CRP-like cAMP-binding protein
VKRALGEAVANAPLAMPTPAPQFILSEFGSSSMTYRVLFWIEDYATDSQARDQVRTNIWYSFRRANIEIPWPIQVEYSREEQPVRTEAHVQDAIEQLGKVDLFSILPDQTRAELARAARDHLFAAGEAIVRQEEPGSSMFVVLDGRVRVALEPSDQEVSVIEKGGFFGEMSMLTGDPRTATVRALTDVRVIEVSAADMRRLALANAGLIEQISAIVSHRREGLAEAHATAAAAAATAGHAPQGLLARIRRFLRLDGS